ncbi:DUF2637 domain-containing protein [Streptomyces sp. NPDC057052]|uniref:DUF2637 domain-containing protein n=1 Tax=Streptomyces sp. NPDC057052 TaxID=3346010 RepID=UPI00363534AA
MGDEPRGPYDSIPFPAQQSWDSAPHTAARDGAPQATAWDSAPHATAWDSAPHATVWDSAPHATVWEGVPHTAVLDGWDPDEELAAMLAPAQTQQPPPEPLPLDRPHHRGERRRTRQEPDFPAGRRVTHATVLIAAIFVCAACLLGWSVSYTYGQLRVIAEGMLPDAVAQWWPLAVYGPWFVAALSILRATVQHRRARRSWSVLLAASAMAAALCVGHSSRSLMAFVMFGVPPVTALVCFWELIGQVSSKQGARQGAHAQRGHGM